MALPRPVKAVVFDMDGLLVDTETVYCEALVAECAHMGHELPDDVLKRMIGHIWLNSALVLTDHFGPGFDTEALREGSTRRFYEIAHAGVGLKAGVVEKSGAWFSYDSTRIGQGRENAKRFLLENPDMASAIEAAIRRNAGLVAEALMTSPSEDDDI